MLLTLTRPPTELVAWAGRMNRFTMGSALAWGPFGGQVPRVTRSRLALEPQSAFKKFCPALMSHLCLSTGFLWRKGKSSTQELWAALPGLGQGQGCRDRMGRGSGTAMHSQRAGFPGLAGLLDGLNGSGAL